MRENFTGLGLNTNVVQRHRVLRSQLVSVGLDHCIKSYPFRGCWVGLFLLQTGNIQKLIGQSIEPVHIFHHGSIEFDSLFSFDGSAMKRLQVEFKGSDRGLEFVGHRIDEVALAAIEVDVLDNPDQIQNDTDEDEGEDDRADAEQNPINASFLGGCRDRAEDIEQDPADRQTDDADDHEDRQENRPLEALAFEHFGSPVRKRIVESMMPFSGSKS